MQYKEDNNDSQQNGDEIYDKRKSLGDEDVEKVMKNKCIGFMKDRYSLKVTQKEFISCGQVGNKNFILVSHNALKLLETPRIRFTHESNEDFRNKLASMP